jgi:hypothetical protein
MLQNLSKRTLYTSSSYSPNPDCNIGVTLTSAKAEPSFEFNVYGGQTRCVQREIFEVLSITSQVLDSITTLYGKIKEGYSLTALSSS